MGTSWKNIIFGNLRPKKFENFGPCVHPTFWIFEIQKFEFLKLIHIATYRPPPLWLCSYVAMWLCGYVAMQLCGYMAMWLCGYVAIKISNLQIFQKSKIHFMFFDRYEIHIQAFEEILTAKLMSGDSSSFTFYAFKILSFLIIKKSGILNFKNSKNGHLRFPELRNS